MKHGRTRLAVGLAQVLVDNGGDGFVIQDLDHALVGWEVTVEPLQTALLVILLSRAASSANAFSRHCFIPEQDGY